WLGLEVAQPMTFVHLQEALLREQERALLADVCAVGRVVLEEEHGVEQCAQLGRRHLDSSRDVREWYRPSLLDHREGSAQQLVLAVFRRGRHQLTPATPAR